MKKFSDSDKNQQGRKYKKESWPKPESVAAHKELLISISKRNWTLSLIITAIALTALGLISLDIWQNKLAVMAILPLWGIALFLAIDTRISRTAYQSLPFSTSKNGEHQCIWCGGRGIYTHGAYRSNDKYHNCSRCKKLLYQT